MITFTGYMMGLFFILALIVVLIFEGTIDRWKLAPFVRRQRLWTYSQQGNQATERRTTEDNVETAITEAGEKTKITVWGIGLLI